MSASWSPDGRHIAYSRRREGRRAHASDIWVMDADGSNVRRLTHAQPTAEAPSWSPDGRYVVFTGNVEAGDAQMRVWCIDMASGEVSPLGDESIEVVPASSLQWSDDGSRVVFVLARHRLQEVASLTVPEGRLERLVRGQRQVSVMSASRRHLVYSAVAADRLDTLYASDWSGGNERQLSHLNAWFEERTPMQVELRNFEVPDGEGGTERVDGWLVRAKGASGPQPLLVFAHGGPASYVLLAYQSHAYWPVLCSRGWAILALNPAGTSSYGRRFTARVRGRWGWLDLPQHLAAVDALQKEGIADERLAITGKSYGGYIAAWAIGQTTRFHAAVVSAPVGNPETHYATSDSGYYADPYSMCQGGDFDREMARRLSPTPHLHKVRTPTLFLQGEEDQRCPLSQSEELFVNLMRSTETPAEMVTYPGGAHHFFEDGKPSHRVDAVKRLVDWVERWVEVPVS